MDIKGIKYIIIVAIIVMLLGLLLIVMNVLGHYEKVNRSNEPRVTTTKKVNGEQIQVIGDKVVSSEPGVVIVDGEVLSIELKEYKAVLGFDIHYAYEFFNPVKINTSTLALINNGDNNVFIKIELLSETNYYNEYDNSLNEGYNKNEKSGYSYEYKFIRGNGIYLKITRCTHEETIDNKLIPIMDFMINSLEIN